MVDATGTTEYEYDALGRLTGGTFPGPKTVSYQYENVGNRLTKNATGYTYDAAYLPLPDWSRRPGLYGPQEFTYLPERDVYVCPQGQEMKKAATRYTGDAYIYRADAKVCNACPVKSACTISPRGRTIRRPFDQEYVERVRAYHDTDPCRRAISKRKA